MIPGQIVQPQYMTWRCFSILTFTHSTQDPALSIAQPFPNTIAKWRPVLDTVAAFLSTSLNPLHLWDYHKRDSLGQLAQRDLIVLRVSETIAPYV